MATVPTRSYTLVDGDAMEIANSLMCSRRIVRLIPYLNFVLFLLFVVPISHHWVDRAFLALRSLHLEDAFGRSMQVWIIASTVIATALFMRMVWKNHRATVPVTSVQFEGILLLVWWLLLVGLSAYAFALGMGG
jgi:hypothetical protein